MKYLNLQELEKLEKEVHESNEAARELKSQKVKRIMSCHVAQTLSEKNVILTGLKFEELKKDRLELIDKQIYVGEGRKIRDGKYRVLGYDQGDIGKIKEKIKGFFKENSKTENIIRINKASIGNEKIIDEVKEFVKHENNKIDFPPAKIKITTCNFEAKPNNKLEFVDARSEAYYGLRKLFKNEQIEFLNVPDLKTKILNQFSTITFEDLPDGRKRVIISEDLSYEFIDALLYFIWIWGLAFAF